MDHKPLACWICGKTVNLNDCKTDEHGLAVHEQCYVTRVALQASFPRPRQSNFDPAD